ncbi:MAG: substrate-binding domain-containing protein [Isosphaeraceae bacterium]|nr:substrate-binding domain-containing protein [Isosphaeraceae bacterium]
MSRQSVRQCSMALLVLAGICGCGGTTGGESRTGAALATGRTLKFVGFDASPELVEAMSEGKIQGLVVQNPYKMGQLGVKTLVAYLEKREVEPQISTGEVMATPENMDEPEIKALLYPPKVEGNEATKGGGRKKWRVMVIPKGTTHEFWKTIHAGALKAAEDLGNVEVVWHGPEKESDRTQQIELVQNAVARRFDGIVLAPLDEEALVEPVEQAIDKGIPVVIIDSALNSKKPVSYVATDNYHGGVLAARRLGELLKGEGKIILLRYMVGSASTEEREKGFTDTMQREFPKITYLSADQYAGATADTAQSVAQSLITRYRGRIDGIFCPNETSTYGMLRVLEEAGLVKAQR